MIKLAANKKSAYEQAYKVLYNKKFSLKETNYQGLPVKSLNQDKFIIHSVEQLHALDKFNPEVAQFIGKLYQNNESFIEGVLENEVIYGFASWYSTPQKSSSESLYQVSKVLKSSYYKTDSLEGISNSQNSFVDYNLLSTDRSVENLVAVKSTINKFTSSDEPVHLCSTVKDVFSMYESIQKKYGDLRNFSFDPLSSINATRVLNKSPVYAFLTDTGFIIIDVNVEDFSWVRFRDYPNNFHENLFDGLNELLNQGYFEYDANYVQKAIVDYENELIKKNIALLSHLQTANDIVEGKDVSYVTRLKFIRQDTNLFLNNKSWNEMVSVKSEKDIKKISSRPVKLSLLKDTNKSMLTKQFVKDLGEVFSPSDNIILDNIANPIRRRFGGYK